MVPKKGNFAMRTIPRLILLGLILVAATPGRLDAQQRIEVGKPYPDFLLPRIDDSTPITLSQFRGKKVLLIQFASW